MYIKRQHFVHQGVVACLDKVVSRGSDHVVSAVEVAGFDIEKLVNCLAVRSPQPHLPDQHVIDDRSKLARDVV